MIKKLWKNFQQALHDPPKAEQGKRAKVVLGAKIGEFSRFYEKNESTIELARFAAVDILIREAIAKGKLSQEYAAGLEAGVNFWADDLFLGSNQEANYEEPRKSISDVI